MAFHGSGGEFGRKTQVVQSWDIIRHGLISEFDASPVVFDEVLNLSSDYIRGGHQPRTGEELFVRLENNMMDEDMLDFLIAVMEHMSFHTDMGTVEVAAVLRSHKEKLEEYRRTEMDDERESKNFVGRNKYITDVMELFNDDRNKYKGVCICGMGGLGKTTLANQICRRMKCDWTIIKVDLREVATLKDVLREIFMMLSCRNLIQETEEGILQQILDFLKDGDRIKCRTILMLDNIDDVMNGGESVKFKNVLVTFGSFLEDFADECKMRLLLTSRVKLSSGVRRFWGWLSGQQDRYFGVVLEKELLPMESKEALQLFNNLMTHKREIESKKVEKIVKLCGYSPLAITTLCSSLRFSLLSPDTVIQNLEPSLIGSVVGAASVTRCLEKTFDALLSESKIYLVRLSVFHTASFDIEAADAVLGGSTSFGKNTKQKMLDLKLHHLVEMNDSDTMPVSHVRYRYSLHPLVFHLLKSRAQREPFKTELRDAKTNFVKHFRKFICKVAEEMDKNCINGRNILGKDQIHVMNFYEILAGPDVLETKDELQTIVECRRIYEIADILLYDDTQWGVINNFIRKTKGKEGHQLEYIFWRVCEATMLMDMDRNQETKRIIDSIELTFPDITGNPMTLTAVIGSFYFLKGRYFRREFQCKEAIQSLKQAANLLQFRGVPKSHDLVVLSKIFNVTGGAYFKQKTPNFVKAIKYHKKALEIIAKYAGRWNIEVPEYKQNIGTCLLQEGEALRKLGKEDEARRKYQEAIKLYDEAIRLDNQMDLHKMDCHAQILQNRGEAHGALGNFDEAEVDLRDAIILRRTILEPPHSHITIVMYKMAEVLYKKGVWLYHNGKPELAKQSMQMGMVLCDQVACEIRHGGLSGAHPVYLDIKALTFKLIDTLQDSGRRGKLQSQYKKFENGAFKKQIEKRRSIKNAHFTQNKSYAASWRKTSSVSDDDSTDPSDDGEDDHDIESQDMTHEGTNRADHVYDMSEREAAVNFTGIKGKLDSEELVKQTSQMLLTPRINDENTVHHSSTIEDRDYEVVDDLIGSEIDVPTTEQSTEDDINLPGHKSMERRTVAMDTYGVHQPDQSVAMDTPEAGGTDGHQVSHVDEVLATSLGDSRHGDNITTLSDLLQQVNLSSNKTDLLQTHDQRFIRLEDDADDDETKMAEQQQTTVGQNPIGAKRQSYKSQKPMVPHAKRRRNEK